MLVWPGSIAEVEGAGLMSTGIAVAGRGSEGKERLVHGCGEGVSPAEALGSDGDRIVGHFVLIHVGAFRKLCCRDSRSGK